MDGSSTRADGQSVGNETETSENETEIVSKRQKWIKPPNSPEMLENERYKPIGQQRKVSIDGINVYLLWNAPVEALGRIFVFGQVESARKAIAPSVEGEMAGDSDGDPNRGDRDGGDGDGTTSGSSIDSLRVKAVQLAKES